MKVFVQRWVRGVAAVAMALTPWIAVEAQTEHTAQVAQVKESASIPVEDQATQDQVERLFKAMRIREQMELMMSQMSTMMQQQVSGAVQKDAEAMPDGSRLTADQVTARQQLIRKFMDRATHLYTVDEILADITPIYQRHMTKSDIEAFIAFFGSSAGQHFLDQQPLIAKEYMPTVMMRVQEKTKTLTEEMKKAMEELSAKEHSESNGSSPQ